MKAILILWKTTERNYGAIKPGDFQILADDITMPSADPNFNPVLPNANEEFLIKADVITESSPDIRVYRAIITSVPTDVKNSTFSNINEYQTSVHYEFKSLPDLISSIKQREQEANSKIYVESDFGKLTMVNAPIMAKYGTIALTIVEQAIYDRTMEVQARVVANDTNARRLIDVATFNDTAVESDKKVFAINDGWQEDNITPLNIPFNEINL